MIVGLDVASFHSDEGLTSPPVRPVIYMVG